MKSEPSTKQTVSSPVVHPEEIQAGSRKSLRIVLGVFGLAGGIVYGTALHHSLLLLAVAGFAFFLAVTDFGRRCPLLLSLRQVLNKSRYGRES